MVVCMSQSRRKFTSEFKAEVVALCRAGDRSIAQIARDLGLEESSIHRWLKKANSGTRGGSATAAGALSSNEREGLLRLRKENARLQMEHEILNKATAFFARENG